MSRRRALGLVGAASFAGLANVPASADEHEGGGDSGTQATAAINVLPNPLFITNARGEDPPFDDDTLLFDPGPVSIPLNGIVEADDEYDSELGRSLNDGKHQVVRPPEGYDREAGYDESWVPVAWGKYSDVGGRVTVGGVKPDNGSGDTGTRVNINVQDGLPNGRYTIWVVKFAALENPDEVDSPFVTPAGNGLVGFHNLGQKFGGPGDTENIFELDDSGNGDIHAFNEGDSLTGVPGFNEPDYPFVGDQDDYEQSQQRLGRIANDLREEDEIHFVGAFHYDDQTWGVYPGPWHVNHFSAVFRF